MNFSLNSNVITSTKADCLVVALPEKGDWPASTTEADGALGGLIGKLQKAGDVTGKNAETNLIPLSDQPWGRLLIVGTGKDADRNSANFRKALTAMMSVLKDGPSKSVLVTLSETAVTGDESVSSELAKLSLIGRTLEDQLYLFNDFKSEQPAARKLNKVSGFSFRCWQSSEGSLQLGPGHWPWHELHPRLGQYTAEHLPPCVAGRTSHQTGSRPRLHQD